VVAFFAGAGYVIPGMLSTLMARYYVIESQFSHLLATILADISIANKHLMSGKLTLMPWAMNQML
jgi:hypothetical protein